MTMLPELGNYALVLALCFAVVQAIFPLLGSYLPLQGVVRSQSFEHSKINNKSQNNLYLSPWKFWGYCRWALAIRTYTPSYTPVAQPDDATFAPSNPMGILCSQLARPAAYGQFFFLIIAFVALAVAFIDNDFSVRYVAENSSAQLPTIYRICAVWGAHEGSLLLWVSLLGLWTVAVAVCSHHLPLPIISSVLSMLGFISVGFVLFLLTTSNPFIRIFDAIPMNGQDLNPLLQDPGLAIHPPILYMGYVGFAVAFAFAMAALLSGRFDAQWARWAKPWTLLAWCFLTLGIILGSWWAYRELGWGGWWFWDPVENASFMPWLAGTALIHSLVVTGKRNAFNAWTVLLAIMAFSLSLLGTFLVRSGVLISVHSFATDPKRGLFMLVFLLLVVGGALCLYAFRANQVRHSFQLSVCSRESLILANNLLLTGVMLTILVATLYPLLLDSLGLEKISIGPPYFNSVCIPFMCCILFLMGFAPIVRWQETQADFVLKKLWLPLLLTILLALCLPLWLSGKLNLAVFIGLALAGWVILATLQSITKKSRYFWTIKKLSRQQWGMVIAHLGVAITTIGIVLVSQYSIQKELRLAPQESVSVGAYQFKFLGVKDIEDANFSGTEAEVWVRKQNHWFALLKPQQRIYPIRQMALADTAIDATLFRDLYVALGEPLEQGAWSFRIYYKPFVRWIWVGGLLMVLGGLLAFCAGPRKENSAESIG